MTPFCHSAGIESVFQIMLGPERSLVCRKRQELQQLQSANSTNKIVPRVKSLNTCKDRSQTHSCFMRIISTTTGKLLDHCFAICICCSTSSRKQCSRLLTTSLSACA